MNDGASGAECPLCSGTSAALFPIYYDFAGRRFQSRRCGACSFVFLEPRPSQEELALLYSDEYFLHDGADCGAHSSTDYETAAVQGSVKFPEILGWIRKYRPAGDFFEVGCGMGYFLAFARDNGFRVRGIEFAALGVKKCREQFGLDVDQTSFEHYTGQPASCDVLFMGDVLEHLVQPLEMIRKAHRLLRASGIVAVEVPSMFNSLAGRLAVAGYSLLGLQRKMPMPPYHINEFTPRTLRIILDRAGFRNCSVIQRIRPPRMITLRGNLLEKAAKKTVHYPNYVLTKTFGVLGDRLLGIGVK